MRIISKFRDYYDSALAHGADMSQIYRREQRVVDALMLPFSAPYNGASDYFEGGILIVCGRPFVRVRHKYILDGKPAVSEWRGSYDATDLCEEKKWRNWREYPVQSSLEKLDANTWDQLCVKHATPVLLMVPWRGESRDGIVTEESARVRADYLHTQRRGLAESVWSVMRDPCLADCEFQKVVHPFQMIQEISMYMGSRLAVESDRMGKLSDTERLEKHGFDKITSFRKGKALFR